MLDIIKHVLQGIPIIYYGTEQAYDGCNDPLNRESLYPNFNTDHPLYQVQYFVRYEVLRITAQMPENTIA